jgi:hypothetical protein
VFDVRYGIGRLRVIDSDTTMQLNDIISAAIEAPTQRVAFTVLVATHSFLVDKEDVRRIMLARRMNEPTVRGSVLGADLAPYREVDFDPQALLKTVRHDPHPITAKPVEE